MSLVSSPNRSMMIHDEYEDIIYVHMKPTASSLYSREASQSVSSPCHTNKSTRFDLTVKRVLSTLDHISHPNNQISKISSSPSNVTFVEF